MVGLMICSLWLLPRPKKYALRTTRLFTRLTAAQMRTQLIETKGYSEAELPCEETIRTKLNALGYGSKRVKKVNP
jgi:hypothetical protein